MRRKWGSKETWKVEAEDAGGGGGEVSRVEIVINLVFSLLVLHKFQRNAFFLAD
jgi:hypothetical protein